MSGPLERLAGMAGKRGCCSRGVCIHHQAKSAVDRIAALEAELAQARADNFALRQNSVSMEVWQDEHQKREEAEAECERLREVNRRNTDEAVSVIHDLRAENERYQRCANCGGWVCRDEDTLWTRHDEDGEPCCCQECLDEHEELGCPFEGNGYREHPIRRANAALRALVGEMVDALEDAEKSLIAYQEAEYGTDTSDLCANIKWYDNLIARANAEKE